MILVRISYEKDRQYSEDMVLPRYSTSENHVKIPTCTKIVPAPKLANREIRGSVV